MLAADFEEILETFQENVWSGPFDWSVSSLKHSPLKASQKHLHYFLIEHSKLITDEVRYASGSGKYSHVTCTLLMPILLKYEEYSIDLGNMITACMGGDMNPVSNLEARIADAIEIDENFRDKLFPDEENMPIADTVENFDAIIGFDTFINETLDRFDDLRRKSETATNDVRALLDLYATSILEFTSSFIKGFIGYVETISNSMQGLKPVTPQNKPYILA